MMMVLVRLDALFLYNKLLSSFSFFFSVYVPVVARLAEGIYLNYLCLIK